MDFLSEQKIMQSLITATEDRILDAKEICVENIDILCQDIIRCTDKKAKRKLKKSLKKEKKSFRKMKKTLKFLKKQKAKHLDKNRFLSI